MTWMKDTYCCDSKNNCRLIGVKTFTDIAPMNVPLMRRKGAICEMNYIIEIDHILINCQRKRGDECEVSRDRLY